MMRKSGSIKKNGGAGMSKENEKKSERK